MSTRLVDEPCQALRQASLSSQQRARKGWRGVGECLNLGHLEWLVFRVEGTVKGSGRANKDQVFGASCRQIERMVLML